MERRALADDVVHENYPLAIGLDVCGACLYSAGLVMQRYGLSYPAVAPGRVSVFGRRLKRNTCWCLGLFVYGCGNLVYTAAMQFAPVSLLTTVFAVSLAMNALLSKLVMGEAVDRNGVLGYCVIMGGIGVSSVGLPKETAAFSADDLAAMAVQPLAALYLLIIASMVGGLTLWVLRFEARFPPPPPTMSTVDLDAAARPDSEVVPKKTLFGAQLCFPTVLSSYETMSQLCIKGGSSMMLVSATSENQTGKAMFWAVILVGLACTAQAVRWLRRCYSRFDTTTMLPVEYGMLTLSSTFGGMMFFQEYKQLEAEDWRWVITGEFILLCGMGCVSLAKLHQQEREWLNSVGGAGPGTAALSGEGTHQRRRLGTSAGDEEELKDCLAVAPARDLPGESP